MRRKGNKKRRDTERDSTTFRRIVKVGTVAAGVAFGGYKFFGSELGRNILNSGYLQAGVETARNFKKDLLNKPADLHTLKDAFDKNIGDDLSAFNKTLLAQRKKLDGVAYDSKNIEKQLRAGTAGLIKKIHIMEQSKERLLYKGAAQELGQAKKSFIEKQMEALDKRGLDEKYKKEVKNFIQSTYDKVNEDSIKNGTLIEELNNHVKKISKKTDKQKTKAFFVDLLDQMEKDKSKHSISKKEIQFKYGSAAEEIYNYQKKHLGDNNFMQEATEKIISKITHTKAATIEDLAKMKLVDENGNETAQSMLDKIDFSKKILRRFDSENKGALEEIDYNKIIKQMAENEDTKKLVIDSSIRLGLDADGKTVLQDYSDLTRSIEKGIKSFSESVPGKILLKGKDLGYKNSFAVLTAGKKDLNAAMSGSDNDMIENMLVFSNNKLFNTKLDQNEQLHINFDDYKEANVVTGWRKKIAQDILGTDKTPVEAYDHWAAQLFDINQDGKSNLRENIKRFLNKDTNPLWERNQVNATRHFFTDNEFTLMDIAEQIGSTDEIEIKSRMFNNNYTTSVFLNKNITGVSDQLLKKIIDSGDISEKDEKLLNILLDNNAETINDYLNEIMDAGTQGGKADISKLENKRLTEIIGNLLSNRESQEQLSHISINEGRDIPILDMAFDEIYQRDIYGQLRVETVKQIMMQKDNEFYKSSGGSTNFIDWINSLDVTEVENKSLKDIGLLGVFERHIDTSTKYPSNLSGKFEVGSGEDHFKLRIQGDQSLRNLFNERLEDIEKNISKHKSYTGAVNETDLYDEFSDTTIIQKSHFNVNNILESINDFIKNGEKVSDIDVDSLKDNTIGFLKEFVAGRNRPEDVSQATIAFQYSMARLNYGIDEIGLGLSQDSMASPLNLIASIGLKRVLPIALGVGTFEYMNDLTRRITGSSIVEAGARGLSYMDIGARKALYATGVGNIIDDFEQTSVIAEYYTGSNHFNTAEEQKDWYENGYSPVRKGRWWSFGSASEFRGGDVSYYQPNYLRRAESNYHDVSVYGSSEEKWAHSWIPTPTHPFSTIRTALNPYWLEKKHLKEGDRPYPLTGKMFTEGTPWGAVLNPTVGEILKPVRMLPQARRRLENGGIDVRERVARINERIKARKEEYSNDDLLIVSGSDIRNAEYVPYGNPESDEVNISISNGRGEIAGYGYMDSIQDIKKYQAPTGNDYVERQKNGSQQVVEGSSEVSYGIYNKIQSKIDNVRTEGIGYNTSAEQTSDFVIGVLQSINDSIKNGSKKTRGVRNAESIGNAPDKKQSTYVYRNKVNEWDNYTKEYYNERTNPNMLIGRNTDFLLDAKYSLKEINGMYGYLSSVVTDSGNTYRFRYEGAGQMTSFSRKFWDANIGGLGGGPMEIGRRFFPSPDRQRVNVNPLKNNMPDWIPDNYHQGDPYTQLPKGEMRLPGKGYETLNELHPDQFGDYGAFDRMKILADIAPNSTEYKKWKNIAQNTITDPELVEEMKDIKGRVSKMSGHHEFFAYNYFNNNTAYKKGLVKSINNGIIQLYDNTNLSLAGITANNNTDYAFNDLINPGDEIVYRTYKTKTLDKDEYGNIAPTNSFAAVVYKKGNSNPINKQLVDQGAAEKNKEDNSVLAKLALSDPTQEASGAVQEIIAHAPIPFVHNKFLKVETAYESYMNETYYGSNFQTWDHPIKGFIEPLVNKQSSKGFINEALSLGYAYYHFNYVLPNFTDKKSRMLSNAILATTNPMAWLGGNLNWASHLANGNIGKGEELTRWQRGAKIGTIVGMGKYAWDNADNPIKSGATMALAGALIKQKNLGWDVIEEITKHPFTTGKAAAIGLGIGIGMSALKNPSFDKEKMFSKWAPKETRKKWELDEYFDRLNYIKYTSLYEAAAKRARFWEHTDIEGIFKDIDKNKKKISKINRKEAKLTAKAFEGDAKVQKEINKLEEKKKLIEEQEKIFYKGGKYTEAAIAYKKKAESTMYGMSNAASQDEILASVPDQYKDFYSSFINETDEKERKKILKSMSPMMRRPLQAAWGMKMDKVEGNMKYFRTHAMPNTGWRGWKPNVNLKHVKMKTIQNEGMLLSDFGYYESEKSTAQYEMAPDIQSFDKGNSMISILSLKRKMHGAGLKLNNISLQTSSTPGIRVVGTVYDSYDDKKNTLKYKVSNIGYRLGSLLD